MKKLMSLCTLLSVLSILYGCADNQVLENVEEETKQAVKVSSEVEAESEEETRETEEVQTTFDINGKKVQLKEKEVMKGKIQMAIPESFTVMSKEMTETKYPQGNPPSLIYTDELGSINIAIEQSTQIAENNEIPAIKDSMKQMFEEELQSVEWINDEVITIGTDKNVGVLELVTPAVDTNIYNLMYFFVEDNQLMVVTFNCTEEQMADWQPVGKEIMKSITFLNDELI